MKLAMGWQPVLLVQIQQPVPVDPFVRNGEDQNHEDVLLVALDQDVQVPPTGGSIDIVDPAFGTVKAEEIIDRNGLEVWPEVERWLGIGFQAGHGMPEGALELASLETPHGMFALTGRCRF